MDGLIKHHLYVVSIKVCHYCGPLSMGRIWQVCEVGKRWQSQESAVLRATQRLEEARFKLADAESARKGASA